MIIDVPEGKDPIDYVWGEMVPGHRRRPPRTSPLAVYDAHAPSGLREFEAARLRIAQINGCLFCQDWRTERDGVKVEDDVRRRGRPSGAPPTRSTTAPGWPRSTPSGTPSTTTGSTTSSGTG